MNGLEALPFLREKGHAVSLVGGGGKTTLLYGMARLCAAEGQRVLVSTTTHIQRPSANYAPDEAARDALWQAGTYAVAGSPAENGKLTQPPGLSGWMAGADTVLLEADGRKRHRAGRGRAVGSGQAPCGGLLPAGCGLRPAGRAARSLSDA